MPTFRISPLTFVSSLEIYPLFLQGKNNDAEPRKGDAGHAGYINAVTLDYFSEYYDSNILELMIRGADEKYIKQDLSAAREAYEAIISIAQAETHEKARNCKFIYLSFQKLWVFDKDFFFHSTTAFYQSLLCLVKVTILKRNFALVFCYISKNSTQLNGSNAFLSKIKNYVNIFPYAGGGDSAFQVK